MKTTTRAAKRALASVAALAAAGTLASGIVVPPATASPWDPHVRVQGSLTCGIIPNGKLQGLWLWTAEDGGAWYSYPGTSYSARYSRDFWNVPSSKTIVHVDIYCNGVKVHQTFGLARPTFGATATRNLYFRY